MLNSMGPMKGDQPTFVTKVRQEVLDLTMCSPVLSTNIKKTGMFQMTNHYLTINTLFLSTLLVH